MDDSTMRDATGKHKVGTRLLVILLLAIPLIDYLFFALLEKDFLDDPQYFFGLIIGQLAFAFVLAGAVGQAWIVSLLLTSLLATAVPLTAIFTWEMTRQPGDTFDLVALTVACTPPIIFCGSLPFLLVRAVSGFRLSGPVSGHSMSRSSRMEDFLVTTAIFAAMIVTVPAAFALTNMQTESLMIMSIIGTLTVGLCLFVSFPATVAYFLIKSYLLRLLSLVGICVGMPFLILSILSMFSLIEVGNSGLLPEIGPTLFTAAGFFALCLVVLRAAGFAWYRDPRVVFTATSNPLEDDEPPRWADSTRLRNRWAALAIILAVVAQVSLYRSLRDQRVAIAQRISEIESSWRPLGGSVSYYSYELHGFRAPSNAAVEDLEFLLRTPAPSWMDLSHAKVTDTVLGKLARPQTLNSVNLQHTEIGDRGLRYLKGADALSMINIGYTKATANGIREFLDGRSGSQLNLSGLSLGDSDLAQLAPFNFTTVILDDNPITSSSLGPLRNVYNLSLRRTKIDGTGFEVLGTMNNLALDYTALSDAQLVELLEAFPNLQGLSIRGTQVTDACLPALKRVKNLAIGDSGITAAGVKSLGNEVFSMLGLHDPKFDGSLFANGNWSVWSLDLRQSSISDKDIAFLANVKHLDQLNLRGCDVSDAALPALAKLNLAGLDITDTKITGLQAVNTLPQGCQVIISRSQCKEGVGEAYATVRWKLDAPANEFIHEF